MRHPIRQPSVELERVNADRASRPAKLQAGYFAGADLSLNGPPAHGKTLCNLVDR
jgi:hypothetical protein